jgi:hypothetical protein
MAMGFRIGEKEIKMLLTLMIEILSKIPITEEYLIM